MTPSPSPGITPDIALTLERLLAVRLWTRQSERACIHQAAQGRIGRQPGLHFRELLYQAGDEVRHIDWRVTARLGRPHTRLYGEEQDQAHWLLLISPAMYFGSRAQLKARLGCELAAALLWQGGETGQYLDLPGRSPHTEHQRGSHASAGSALPPLRQGWIAPPPLDAGPDPGTTHPAPRGQIDPDKPSPGTGPGTLPAVATPSPAPRYPLLADPRSPGSRSARAGAAGSAGRQTAVGSRRRPRFRARCQRAADEQAEACRQQLLPPVTRLYRLDNGATPATPVAGGRMPSVLRGAGRARTGCISPALVQREALQAIRAELRDIHQGPALEPAQDPRLMALGGLLIAAIAACLIAMTALTLWRQRHWAHRIDWQADDPSPGCRMPREAAMARWPRRPLQGRALARLAGQQGGAIFPVCRPVAALALWGQNAR